jgi:hypothetical protein
MASPWKFLVRLVSPRRQQKQDEVAIEDVKPEVLAITGPSDAPVIESLPIANQPVGDLSQTVDRSDLGSAEPEQSDERRGDVLVADESSSERVRLEPEPVLPDVEIAAAKVESTAAATPAKGKTRAKKVEAAEVVAQPSPATPSVSDLMVSLDEEIAVLRTQLTGKLRLQNVQLKTMLARFEDQSTRDTSA